MILEYPDVVTNIPAEEIQMGTGIRSTPPPIPYVEDGIGAPISIISESKIEEMDERDIVDLVNVGSDFNSSGGDLQKFGYSGL